jgi:hypothetical protein
MWKEIAMRAAFLIPLLATATVFAQTPQTPQTPQTTPPVQPGATPQGGAQVTSRVRFSDRVSLRAAPEGALAPRVDIRLWSIPEQQQLRSLEIAGLDMTPGKSLVIYNLRAGELTTVINGKRIARKVGDFWTLRAGESQTLETGNDTAVVETIVVEQ